jgi:hypothetical protein
MAMEFTKKFLRAKSPCADGFRWFSRHVEDGTGYQEALDTLVNAGRVEDACWLLGQFGPTNAVLEVDALEAEAIVFAGTVEVRGSIDVATVIQAGRSIRAGGGLRAGSAIVAGEDIRVAGSIISQGTLQAGGDVRADWGVEVQGDITCLGDLHRHRPGRWRSQGFRAHWRHQDAGGQRLCACGGGGHQRRQRGGRALRQWHERL